jgi:putative heme-binding domain-containing protein
LIPTGVAPGDGGAYVGASTELIHFADDDRDLHADRQRVVLSGFGTEDTHHIIHTLRWGPEQRLYFNQSIYIHSHVETPWGVQRLNAGGVWQFRPDTLHLGVFARGLVNPWGIDFDSHGTAFATDGAGGEGINYIVPGAAYTTAFGASRILAGLNPGSPKHCGLEIVESTHLPDDWYGSFITCDFRGHRVCRFTLREDGSGFSSQEQTEVIKSSHPAFRPVDAKVGPDGALYIADWYNPIIQHGEVDFRDDRRDHTHGRIWRVTYTGKPLVDRPQLADAPTESLAAELASPNLFNRRQAQRLLKERGPEVLPVVMKWANTLDNTATRYHQHRLETLWLHLAHDVFNRELLQSLLRCRDAAARAAATRVLGDWQDRAPDVLELLERRVADDHPRVRLEAVRALAKVPQPRAIELAARALDPPTERAYAEEAAVGRKPAAPAEFRFDAWLDYALWLTARELQPVWEPALLRGEIDFGGNSRHMAFVLKSAGSAATTPALLQLLSSGEVPADDVPEVLEAIAAVGRPQDLQSLLQLAIDSADDAAAQRYLQALVDAFRLRKAQPSGPVDGLIARADRGADPLAATAARLVGLWKWSEGSQWLGDLAASGERAPQVRLAAIDGLADFGGEAAARQLQSLAAADEGGTVALRAIAGLLTVRPRAAAASAAALLQRGSIAPEAVDELVKAFISRPEAADQLAEALEGGGGAVVKMSADAAVLGLRAVRASGRRYPRLEGALAKAGGVSSEPLKLTAEQLAALAQQVAGTGDPVRGEAVYRRSDLACVKCHAIGDAGGLVGPNLISLGSTAQVDYLLESLLDPNAKVKEGYHTVVIVDDDGKQWSGIKLRQTDRAVILRNADGDELQVPLASIDVEAPGISLMPSGLTEKLTRQELVDLTAFLSALGRVPEYTLGQQSIARRWEVLVDTPPAANQLRRVSYAHATTDDPAFLWRAAYSEVSGELPLGDAPEIAVRNRSAPGERGVSFARCELETTQPGQAILRFNSVAGLTAWLGDQPLEIQKETAVTLPAGRSRLTVSIDRAMRSEPLRVELTAAEGSAAIAKFVSGP